MKAPALALSLALLAAPVVVSAQLTVRSAAGVDAAAIAPTVTQFRNDLGGALNGPGAHAGSDGRREINWDAVPNGFSAGNSLIANFFNQNSQRGLQLVNTAGGTGFMVSDAAAGGNGVGVRFDNLLAGYSSEFTTFTPQKLFTSLGSNVYDVIFFVPLTGPTLPGSARATVSGFGSVFADVDQAGTTALQFFDINDNSLGAFAAPTASQGLSFLAAFVNGGPQIARVRFTLGNVVIGTTADLRNFDVVVADDFIYGEPVSVTTSVPEPGSLGLLGLGVASLLWSRRRANLR